MNLPPIIPLYSLILVLQSCTGSLIKKDDISKSTGKASKQDWFRHTFGFDAAQNARYN